MPKINFYKKPTRSEITVLKMSEASSYDVIIIGAGPAGLTAGIYCARKGLRTLILERQVAGGRVNEAPFIAVSYTHLTLPTTERV